MNTTIPLEFVNPSQVINLMDVCGDYFTGFNQLFIRSMIKIIIIYEINWFLSFYKGENKILKWMKNTAEFLNENVPFGISLYILSIYYQTVYDLNVGLLNTLNIIFILIILFLVRKDMIKLFKMIISNKGDDIFGKEKR